jgi:hypothetical protein
MVRPVERQEIPPPLPIERVQQARQSDPDAKRQFARQLQNERSKRRERAVGEEEQEESALHDEPSTEEKLDRGAKEAGDEMNDKGRPEGKIDLKV